MNSMVYVMCNFKFENKLWLPKILKKKKDSEIIFVVLLKNLENHKRVRVIIILCVFFLYRLRTS